MHNFSTDFVNLYGFCVIYDILKMRLVVLSTEFVRQKQIFPLCSCSVDKYCLASKIWQQKLIKTLSFLSFAFFKQTMNLWNCQQQNSQNSRHTPLPFTKGARTLVLDSRVVVIGHPVCHLRTLPGLKYKRVTWRKLMCKVLFALRSLKNPAMS